MNEDPNNVSAEEVQDFLRSGEKSEPVELDIDPEQIGVISQPEEVPPFDSPLRPELDPDVQSEATETLWTLQASPDLRVEVEELEKNLFWKAALNDTPVILPTYVRNVQVTCRTLSQFEMDVMFSALDSDSTKRVVLTEGQYASQMQDYSLFCQVQQVGDQPFKYAFEATKYDSLAEAAQALRLHHTQASRTFNQALRSCLIHALRVFSIKIKLCTDNLHNENFWTPPEED